jgi:hypothetical protein
MRTTIKILSICLLMLGQLLITPSAKAQTGAIEVQKVATFTHVYSDRGTGGDADLSTWAPVVPSGFYAVGYLAKNGYNEPTTSVIVVKGLVNGAIAYPTGYRLVWTDKGSGGDQDGAFWEPIAPSGYIAMGTVVTASWTQPPLTAVVCVRADLTALEKGLDWIWNDKGSGADKDLSLWEVKSSSSTQVASGSFAAYPSHDKGASSPVSYCIKLIEMAGVSSYTHVYSDRGTGADSDLSTWTPNLPSGFHAVGYLAKNGYDQPTREILVVKGLVNGIVAYPTGYRLVWTDKGSGGDQDGAFWEPIAPSGYVAMGTVVTASWTQPPLDAVVCVRADLTVKGMIGSLIWNDAGSGADADLSLWTVNAASYLHTASGSFCSYASHTKPDSSNVAFAIKN